MDITKEFSDLTGITVEDLTSGSYDEKLILPRGVYIRLRVYGHGESCKSVAKELNMSYGRARYAMVVADEDISAGYKDAIYLWRMVEHLTLEYLYHKAYELSGAEEYSNITDSKMRNLMDLVCKEYDKDYTDYSYSKKAVMRKKAEKWFIAILKTV